MKKRTWIILILLLLPIILILGFAAWALTGPDATAEAQTALNSDNRVIVSEVNGWTVFTPTAAQPSTGLILYPSARIDPDAFAPVARDIAAAGYLVVVTPMPLNLALFNPGQAADVIAAFPDIEHWAVGGHSLGGAMAANFAANNPDQVDGLVLWAAYPAQMDNLSNQDLAVISIYGTNDGIATPQEIEDSRPFLPPDTLFVPIEGGNHGQFAAYGPQAGDNPAAISPAEQQAQTVEATIELLASLSDSGR